MIEDKFEFQEMSGDKDEQVATVRCKPCETVFEVRMEILRPKNCRFVLGKSLTVICPTCKAEAMTTEYDSKVAALELLAKRFRVAIKEQTDKISAQFHVDAVIDWQQMSMALTCVRCQHKFVANITQGINAHWKPGELAVRCPICSTTEVMDKAKTMERLEVVAAVMQLRDIDTALDKLKKGGPDAEQGVQAAL